MKYNTFENMPVWQKAMKSATDLFALTDTLPRKEDYGYTSQIRRSALSISANIAEAFGRKRTKDKINFYYHSRGSFSETRNHLIYGFKVGYLRETEFEHQLKLLDEIWKELNALISALKKPQPQP